MMPQNDDGKGQGSRGLIAIAVIGLIGTLGAALISSWDKFFNSKQSVTSETLTVPADSSKGIFWENKENSDVEVNFKATVTRCWLVIPKEFNSSTVPDHAKGCLTPDGASNYFNKNKPACPYPTGALVVVDEQKNCKAGGVQGSFGVKPGETVFFKMNDLPDASSYLDNNGQLNVKLSILKK